MKRLIQLKMRIIKILILSLIAMNVYAQESPVDKIFDKYGDKEGFTTVIISKYMFSLFANSKNSNDDFSKIISGLESIKILSVQDSTLDTKINLYKELIRGIPLEQYHQLLSIKEKNQDTKIMIKKRNGKIHEFLMIGGGSDNFVISITGNINLESISKLSKAMDIKGLENVDKLESSKK